MARIAPVFNELSFSDQLKLCSAAGLVTMSGIAKGDTQHSAWKFPFYLLYIGYLVAPIPVPGSNMIPLVLSYGWIRLGLTGQARWAQGELKKNFNRTAMVANYLDYIQENPEMPGRYSVQSWQLAAQAYRQAYRDVSEAGGIFAKWVQRSFKP